MKKIVVRLMVGLFLVATVAVLFTSCDKCGNEKEYEVEGVNEAGEVYIYKETRCV